MATETVDMNPTISLREIIDRRCEREYGARYRSVIEARALKRKAVWYVFNGRSWRVVSR